MKQFFFFFFLRSEDTWADEAVDLNLTGVLGNQRFPVQAWLLATLTKSGYK